MIAFAVTVIINYNSLKSIAFYKGSKAMSKIIIIDDTDTFMQLMIALKV